MFEDAYADEDPLVAGALVDQKYMVVKRLSQGGQGSVYLAEHLNLTGLFVAIKVLSGKISGEALERFKREALVMAKFAHPNIVRIMDFGNLEGGQPFMVMEYLSGEPLKKRIERGPIPLESTIAILEQICSALQAAHAYKIVHRDLKPDNIFLCFDEQQPGSQLNPQVKLLDFGVTKVLGVDTITPRKQGNFLGTPQYMSPEQAKGALEIDHRADLFSLCTILFEMLTGHLPFGGNQLIEIVSAIVLGEPRSLKALLPNIPDAVEKAVFKGLSKTPSDRFTDAQALFQAFKLAAFPPVLIEAQATGNPFLPQSNSLSLQQPPLQNARLGLQLQQLQTPNPTQANPFKQGADSAFKINQTPSPFFNMATVIDPVPAHEVRSFTDHVDEFEDSAKTTVQDQKAVVHPDHEQDTQFTSASHFPTEDDQDSPTIYLREPPAFKKPLPIVPIIVAIAFFIVMLFIFSQNSSESDRPKEQAPKEQVQMSKLEDKNKAPEIITFKISRVVKNNASSATATKFCEAESNCYAALDFYTERPGEFEIKWYRNDNKGTKLSKRISYQGNSKFYSTEVSKLNFQADDIGKWTIELYFQRQLLQKIQFEVIK